MTVYHYTQPAHCVQGQGAAMLIILRNSTHFTCFDHRLFFIFPHLCLIMLKGRIKIPPYRPCPAQGAGEVVSQLDIIPFFAWKRKGGRKKVRRLSHERRRSHMCYARKPLRIVSSASSGVRPSVSSFSSWSPAILPMAASWISWASGQLAVMAGTDSMRASPMMMLSH